MAWPNKIYVATTSLGVYYTEDFIDPSTQPTWTAVNTGLASLECVEFWLDPLAQDTRQYVLAGNPGVLYRRELGGSWQSILTREEARAVTGYAWTDDWIAGFCCDPTIAGRLWAVYRNSDGGWNRPLCILRSDDYGETWAFAAEPYNGIYLYQVNSLRANGDNLFVAAAIGAGGTAVTYCSDDAGSTWQYVAQEYNTTWPICHNPLLPTSAYTTTHTNSPLRRVTSSGVGTTLQDGIGPGRWDAMWFHPSDADHQRVLRGGKLHVTADGWTNYSQGDAITPTPISFAPRAGSDVNQMLVGLTIAHGIGQDHVIGVLYEDDDVTATGIAGGSPGSAPYTDSIPYTCGGLAKMGIWAVEEEPSEGPTPPPGSTITPPDKPGESPSTPITLGGDVLTQAVTMPDYTGDDRGEPLPGDRGAWDVVDYAALHARDLKDDAPVHHVPEGDASGDAPVWDGEQWVSTGVATQAELDTHEGEANPHGTELGDLADVDLTTDPPEDGEGLVWDEVAGEWVPADVTTLADHDHSGDAGDGGTFDAANLTSGAATDGQVPTADGIGGITWEDPAGGGGDVATDAIWDAKGDLAIGTGANAASRLAVGADDQVLTADAAAATGVKWANNPAGFANPMTTAGDIITGGAGGTADRLGIGTAGQVLKVNAGATAPEWDDESGGGGGETDVLMVQVFS